MNIGELFVSLGVKGGKETQNTIKGVKGGMKDVKSMSLEAKAAILATVYGLQRLMSQSMNNGTAIAQFSNLTGLSTKKLQEWQYASKIAGGSAEEITGVVTNMQHAFAAMEYGEGPAKYLGEFANGLRTIGESFDPSKMKDAFYTLEKARAFLKGGGTGDFGRDNLIMESMGIAPNMIGAMRAGQFDDSVLNKATPYSDKQAKELQRIKGMWTDLGDTVQKQIGKLNVKYGGQLIKDLSGIAKNLAEVITQLIELSNHLGVFSRISEAMKNIANLLDIIKGNMKLINEGPTEEEKDHNAMMTKTMITTGKQQFGGKAPGFFDIIKSLVKQKYGFLLGDPSSDISSAAMGNAYSKDIAPNVGLGFQGNQAKVVSPNVNINNYGVDMKDVDAVGRSSSKGVQSAFRQLQAQGL